MKYSEESFRRNYRENLVPLISAERPDNYLIYKVGDKVAGAMLMADCENDLRITVLQGLGDGAGTSLVKPAVLASIARAFGEELHWTQLIMLYALASMKIEALF